MPSIRSVRHILVTIALAMTATVGASEDIVVGASEYIVKERSELMKGVREATKPVGAMLRGDADFDAAQVQESLAVYSDASGKLGDLVPEGSEGGQAAPAVWEDPEGFAAAIEKWQSAVAAAIEADPQDIDSAKPVLGAVLQNCKGCHDNYRIEDE